MPVDINPTNYNEINSRRTMDFSSASFIMALGVVLPGWAYFAIGIPVLAGTILALIKTAKDNKKKKAKASKRS